MSESQGKQLLFLQKTELYCKFPIALMGALAPGSAYARPSAQAPLDTSGNLWAQMSGGGKKILAISGNAKHFLLIFFLLPKIIFFFVTENPKKNSGRKVTWRKEERKRKTVNSGQLVP
jgi:hypothetical protein